MSLKGMLAVILIVLAVVFILKQIKPIGDGGILEKIRIVDKTKKQTTHMNLKSLQREIIVYISEHGKAPESLKQLPRHSKYIANLPDAWGTPIRYRRISGDHFLIISAGIDREFDTSDDIILDN